MQIIMQDSVAAGYGTLKAGHVYDLAPERAKKLVDRGLARVIESDEQADDRPPQRRRTTSLPHGDKGGKA